MKATAHAQSAHASHDVRLTSLRTRPGARDSVVAGGGDATAVPPRALSQAADGAGRNGG